MVTFMNQIILFLMLYQKALSVVPITCVSEISTKSGSNNGDKTSKNCSNSDHTLVSCGYHTNNGAENDVLGSWIDGQTCWAENYDNTGSAGVYANARCCNLKEYGITCHTVESDISGQNNDDKTDVSCAAGETLMGCTSRSFGARQDGNYVGNKTADVLIWAANDDVKSNSDTCTAWNSEDNSAGVRAYATCCSSPDSKVTIDCVTRYRDLTDSQWTTSCPAGYTDYFMTSCSAVNLVRDMNKWRVVDGTNNCQVRNAGTDYGYATMICCGISTVSPTNAPSISPTSPPSNAPSLVPTQPPSIAPSIAPTQPPSLAPSVSPTQPPSFAPSNAPTQPPSISPTQPPSLNPSTAPSLSPTQPPSLNPSITPTQPP
eukprot:32519_1